MCRFICVVTLLVLNALGGLAAVKQPVYIYLYSQISDHVNSQHSEDRIRRTLRTLEKHSAEHPQYGLSASFQFSGPAAQDLEERAMTGTRDLLRDAAKRGVLELGYHGADEPVYWRRIGTPPSVKNAKTSRERWLARGEHLERFLTEYKDPLTGEPDPGRPGGLKRMQAVFGQAACITGFTEELGSISALVHTIRKYNRAATMSGTPAQDRARKIPGYSGSIGRVGELMSPQVDCAPELFWQDNVLRISDTTGAPVRVVYSYEGPEALQEILAELDRSRPHIIKVFVGHYSMYLRPGFTKSFLNAPNWYGYFHPESPKLPAAVVREMPERREVFAIEERLIEWLLEDFFPSNPGSRFVSNADLKKMARTSVGSDISRETLTAATADLLKVWKVQGNHPPDYARGNETYFSLAEMFQMLTGALAELDRSGSLPQSVALTPVYGPLDLAQAQGPNVGSVKVRSVLNAATGLAPGLNDQAWKPLPGNAVPDRVAVDGIEMNAAQFLRVMAQAFQAASPDEELLISMSQMFNPLSMTLPTKRAMSDRGGTWTLKPAPLKPLE